MPVSSFVILVVLFMIGALIYIELAGMPGKEARARNHPHADAINLLGWIGLLLGIAPWLVAMVWARLPPPRGADAAAIAGAEVSTQGGVEAKPDAASS